MARHVQIDQSSRNAGFDTLAGCTGIGAGSRRFQRRPWYICVCPLPAVEWPTLDDTEDSPGAIAVCAEDRMPQDMAQKSIDNWLSLAEYDLATAEAMLQAKRLLYVGFMCQQAIERILKACFVKYHGVRELFGWIRSKL